MEGLLSYGLIVLGLLLLLVLRSVGNNIGGHLKRRRAHLTQARRHFVKAAMFLNRSRGKKVSASEGRSYAGMAIVETDLAIELNPNDAATLIIKGLALKQLKKPAAALKVLNTALSKECAKSLSKQERADTLLQRAELTLEQFKGNRDERIQEVLIDVQESINLQPSNSTAHFMLGTACERFGDVEDALVAYQQALVVNPSYPEAQAALRRLESSSEESSIGISV